MVHGFWLANCYKNPPCAIMPDQVKVLKAQRPHHRDLAVGSRALAIGRKIGIRGRRLVAIAVSCLTSTPLGHIEGFSDACLYGSLGAGLGEHPNQAARQLRDISTIIRMDPPPLVFRAFGAHCHELPTMLVNRVEKRSG